MVINHCQTGWTEISSLPLDVQQFVHSCVHLTVSDGLLIYDTRIVVPFSLRTKILDALHGAHQGKVESRERAQSSVWWPKIGKHIERMVTTCFTCASYRTPSEPLLSSSLPDLQWQKVAIDVFKLNGKRFLIAIDFFSRFIELIELRSEIAEFIITALKKHFWVTICNYSLYQRLWNNRE